MDFEMLQHDEAVGQVSKEWFVSIWDLNRLINALGDRNEHY